MDEEVMMSDNGTLDSNDHDGYILINSDIKENENLNDLNKRLTVSRYVNDLDTKGMLTVVDTESAEKIAQKKLEQTKLEEPSEENETSHSHLILDEACKDESEQKLLEQDVESCGKNSLLLEKTKEIAGLRQELVLISKLLTFHDDHQLHNKISESIVSASRNDKHVGSVTLTPKKLEDLKKLSHKQLINYFKNEINQLKREHNITIREMTEEYFSVKRRCLNLEKPGLLYSFKENKEFDVLQKKIPDVISKLDKVLLEGEKSVFEEENSADIKSCLDSLLLENRQLKDSLSEAGKKMLQLSQAEANHRKLIQRLESDAEDLRVEASIYADVYGSFVRERVKHVRCAKEITDLESHIMREAYELISKDLVNRVASESNNDLKDSCLKSYLIEECCAVTYKGILKANDKKLGEFNIDEFEKEWYLRSGKEKSTKIHWLERLLKEKDSLVKTAEIDLATEMEKLEIQINNLQYQIDQQAVVIQDKNKEMKVVSARALKKIKSHEIEISELRQNLELTRKNMKIIEKEKVNSEMKLISSEADQKRLKSQFLSIVLSLTRWTKEFDRLECLVAEKTKKANFRLKSMHSQLTDLLDEVDYLKARESKYKQLMEAKTCDLQKAETEVDLLGDEIESLMDLLEKIYIALDHYSPILKHYPGIIEILELVRRELRGESKRLSVY